MSLGEQMRLTALSVVCGALIASSCGLWGAVGLRAESGVAGAVAGSQVEEVSDGVGAMPGMRALVLGSADDLLSAEALPSLLGAVGSGEPRADPPLRPAGLSEEETHESWNWADPAWSAADRVAGGIGTQRLLIRFDVEPIDAGLPPRGADGFPLPLNGYRWAHEDVVAALEGEPAMSRTIIVCEVGRFKDEHGDNVFDPWAIGGLKEVGPGQLLPGPGNGLSIFLHFGYTDPNSPWQVIHGWLRDLYAAREGVTIGSQYPRTSRGCGA